MSQVNLFRIQEDVVDAFKSSIENNYEFIKDSTVDNFYFRLFWQECPEKTNVNWGWAFSIFDEPIKQTHKAPKGIIIIQDTDLDGNVYAVSFGVAHFHIDSFCDKDFAFDFASRVIIQQTRLTSTINNSSKQNKTINSFKGFDRLEINSGESYTKLKLDINLAEESIFANNVIEVGTSLKMALKDDSLNNLTKLILYVEKTLNDPKINNIPICKVINKPSEIEALEKSLKTNFLMPNSTLTLSEFDIVGVEEVFVHADSFEIHCDENEKNVPFLDLAELKTFFKENNITDVDRMLKTKIRFLSNGSSLVTKPIRNFIDYLDESKNALLVCGKWYQFNTDFCQYLNNSLEEIPVIYNPEHDFSKSKLDSFIEKKLAETRESHNSNEKHQKNIRNRFYKEFAFNSMMEQDGYMVLDRKITNTNVGRIEPCDLWKDCTIFSVKRGNCSADLTYVVTQSEVAIDYYKSRPKKERPKNIALWLLLSRKKKLKITDERLDWDDLGMLLLKMEIDGWKKKVNRAGMAPYIYINYETD